MPEPVDRLPDAAELVTPIAEGGDAWTWRFRPAFAPWLRARRQTHRLTLKAAAERLGVSVTRLHKLETGARVRPPSLELIGRIAALYGRELDEVLACAGFKMEVPAPLRDAARCDETFAALVLHPSLRPSCMDERWVESYSRIQKAQWVEFARRLAALARRGELDLDQLLGLADG